jgi:hypothetical protein
MHTTHPHNQSTPLASHSCAPGLPDYIASTKVTDAGAFCISKELVVLIALHHRTIQLNTPSTPSTTNHVNVPARTKFNHSQQYTPHTSID